MQETLPFPFNTPPAIAFALLGGWWLVFVAGRIQLRKARLLVEKLILDRAASVREKPKMTLQQYHDLVLPELVEKVRGLVWFVPHRTELFPVPAKPDYLIERLGVNPEFVGRVLIQGGVELKGRDYHRLKESIEKQAARPRRLRT